MVRKCLTTRCILDRIEVKDFEARRAVEIAFGTLEGAWAGLSQESFLQLATAVRRHHQAILLDERSVEGLFAVPARLVHALPGRVPEQPLQISRERMGS